MARIDWDKWRLKYVSGPDSYTLEALSKEPGAPALNTLKKVSSRESWTEQRKRFRHQTDTMAHHDAVVDAAADKVSKIIDTAEMLTRHNSIATGLLAKGAAALSQLDPSTLKPTEIAQFLKMGIDVQRIIEGMATERSEMKVDLSQLTDAELEKIANGG